MARRVSGVEEAVRKVVAALIVGSGQVAKSLFGGVRGCCRFEPTCSAYAKHVVMTCGPIRAVGLIVWRVLRCGPWSKGGYDPPPGWNGS